MTDSKRRKIIVRDFRGETVIGVNPAEAHCRQQIRADMDIIVAAESEDSSDGENASAARPAVDYDALLSRLRAVLKNERFALVEDLAERFADVILREFGAAEARVYCAKTRLYHDVNEVGVEIIRLGESDNSQSRD